ncbi:hypothetical protein L228DRAFT_244087 [Xylona heveae TC161]|uniref:Uncharacterized protein n=1 Tax=Xylona heveae (strain CBS 132557 / TC161) TaxID=1328760 RepID=A0A165IRN1_XYLHT|nr:hypothetical protein L228DRAFT_244087 [Xylona heveae TC161]KZF25286.1 hypothetical protein L228DRAFT_244087 [Xylona heveae TC161]
MASTQNGNRQIAVPITNRNMLTDNALQPFRADSFDPADYLNTTLPPLRLQSDERSTTALSLAELLSHAQTLLSQLSAQTSQMSDNLTQLTDDILRSGGRLAYEVEVLRGDSATLSEEVAEGLKTEVAHFVPGGLPSSSRRPSKNEQPVNETTKDGGTQEQPSTGEPAYIAHLRTLSLVRSRMDKVVRVFGEAMDWTLPPSELSVASSFISVSGPDSSAESQSREEKGQEKLKKLRDEIADLLLGNGDGRDGVEAAQKRVEELRELAKVWKGTIEEKARVRFIEGLYKIVEDRQKSLGLLPDKVSTASQSELKVPKMDDARQMPRQSSEGGRGFIENLQRIRNNIYLE